MVTIINIEIFKFTTIFILININKDINNISRLSNIKIIFLRHQQILKNLIIIISLIIIIL